MTRAALFAAALLLLAPAHQPRAETAQAMPARSLPELSGLAHSRRDAGIWWGHNDSGDAPVLYRIDEAGNDLGHVTVPAARAIDWEDLAAFDSPSGPALLVADTGDNFAARNRVTLYAVRDPGRTGDVALLWRLDFRYPDGPRDCEAVAVDGARREILLLTKREHPRRLYRLPLPPRTPAEVQVAEFLGTVPALPSTLTELPSAMDVSPDGQRLAILTYRHLYLFRGAPQGWAAALAQRAAAVIGFPDMPQAEAMAFDASGRRVMVGSEGRPPRFAILPLP